MISVHFRFAAEGYMGLRMLNDQHPFPRSATASTSPHFLAWAGAQPIVLCE